MRQYGPKHLIWILIISGILIKAEDGKYELLKLCRWKCVVWFVNSCYKYFKRAVETKILYFGKK